MKSSLGGKKKKNPSERNGFGINLCHSLDGNEAARIVQMCSLLNFVMVGQRSLLLMHILQCE